MNERSVSVRFPAAAVARRVNARRLADASRGLACGVAFPMVLLTLGIASQGLRWTEPALIVTWLLLAPVAVHLAWQFARDVAAQLGGPLERRSAIVCASGAGRQFRSALASLPGVRFCGFFDDRAVERLGLGDYEPLLGPIGEVCRFSKEQRIDVVYIALPLSCQRRVAELLAQLQDTTASVYFVPDASLFGPLRPRVEILGGKPVLRLCETPFRGASAFVKRAEDLVLGALMLLACLPLLLIIAAAVKLDSPGPVVFRQRRHGLDGREIVVYKFRTMSVLEDGPELRQAQSADPRVTRVGALLRRYSLDELPQLVNVLQGRMSLVGPRPHALAHTEQYRKLVSGYMIRHKVRPGITGWAQVNGLRGETDTLEKMAARVEHDLAYLSDWSLAFDLAILIRTAAVVIRGDNAR
jgi:putative colanic acid biosynthesis UDP-glucose lipid carrier transferase